MRIGNWINYIIVMQVNMKIKISFLNILLSYNKIIKLWRVRNFKMFRILFKWVIIRAYQNANKVLKS
jgi:hypothetical protein